MRTVMDVWARNTLETGLYWNGKAQMLLAAHAALDEWRLQGSHLSRVEGVFTVHRTLRVGHLGRVDIAVEVSLARCHIHVGEFDILDLQHLEGRAALSCDHQRGVHLGHIGRTGAEQRRVVRDTRQNGHAILRLHFVELGVRKSN